MSVLEACRRRLGPPPRSFAPEMIREIRGIYNPLLSTHPWDSLMRTFFDQAKLREHGEIVWAQVVQANDFLFNPGLRGESHPATVVFATPKLDDPSDLPEIAARLESIRESRPNDPDLKAARAWSPSVQARLLAPSPRLVGRPP